MYKTNSSHMAFLSHNARLKIKNSFLSINLSKCLEKKKGFFISTQKTVNKLTFFLIQHGIFYENLLIQHEVFGNKQLFTQSSPEKRPKQIRKSIYQRACMCFMFEKLCYNF